jgi:hypothetical protein
MFAERLAEFLKGLLGAVLPELLLFGGAAAMIYGIHLMNVPGAWIAGGVLAMMLAMASTRK